MRYFKHLLPAICVFAFLSLLSCGGGGDDFVRDFTNERIIITETEVTMEAKETSKTINVDANCQWTASVTNGWTGLSLNPSDNTLMINTPVNDTRDELKATVIVKSQSGKVSRDISVTQRGGEARLDVSPTSLSYSGEGDKKDITIKTNSEWSIAGGNDWCHLSVSSGTGDSTVTVTVDANQNESARPSHKLIVSVTNDTIKREVAISQEPAPILNVRSSVATAPATANSIEIEVVGTATWRATSNQTWAHVDDNAQGTGTGTFIVKIDDNKTPNTREAIITLKWSRETTSPVVVTIKQAAGELPKVSINEPTNITRVSADVSGSCTSMFPVSRYGFCFALDGEVAPVVTNDQWTITHEGSPEDGKFFDTLKGLISGRTYYVRAFAESEVGIDYSKTVKVPTLGDAPDPGENPTPDFAPRK